MKLLTKLKNLFGFPRLRAKYLRKGCVNVLDVPTGRMSKAEADAYIRSLSNACAKSSKDYHTVYVGVTEFTGKTVVKYMYKDVLNILEIETGNMKLDKSEEYIAKMDAMMQNIDGYDIKVIRKITK